MKKTEEKLSEGEKTHPYAAETRVRREIMRVEKMSPESEKIFGKKEVYLERLKRKLKAIIIYQKSGKRNKAWKKQMPTQEEKEDLKRRMELKDRSRRNFEKFFK